MSLAGALKVCAPRETRAFETEQQQIRHCSREAAIAIRKWVDVDKPMVKSRRDLRQSPSSKIELSLDVRKEHDQIRTNMYGTHADRERFLQSKLPGPRPCVAEHLLMEQ